jgi:hypothetical protein
VLCPFCKVPISGEHKRNCPSLEVVGQTLTLDDYVKFQYSEASPVDLESLVQLERNIARGLMLRRESDLMKYAAFIFAIIVVIALGLYFLKSFGILP